MQTIVAHGYDFFADELLFLSKTFESVSSGTIELERWIQRFVRDEGLYENLCLVAFVTAASNESSYIVLSVYVSCKILFCYVSC